MLDFKGSFLNIKASFFQSPSTFERSFFRFHFWAKQGFKCHPLEWYILHEKHHIINLHALARVQIFCACLTVGISIICPSKSKAPTPEVLWLSNAFTTLTAHSIVCC